MAISETRTSDVQLPDATGDVAAPPRKPLTIGAVCKALGQEFPDISISKIRYLEDQKLLTPRRTQGGYRLYTQADIQRLRLGQRCVAPAGGGRCGARRSRCAIRALCTHSRTSSRRPLPIRS